MDIADEAQRLGQALLSIVSNATLPIDLGPYREEHEDGPPGMVKVRRVCTREPTLAAAAWAHLAAELRRCGWEAEADDLGITTRTMRVTLDTGDVVAVFRVLDRRHT